MIEKDTRQKTGAKLSCKYFLAGIIGMLLLLFTTTPLFSQDVSDDLSVIDYSSPKKI